MTPSVVPALLDDDTIRSWHQLYAEEGIEGLARFNYEGSACRLSKVQQDQLKAWITETLPRTTREVGAWIETECSIAYQSRSGRQSSGPVVATRRLGQPGPFRPRGHAARRSP